MRGFLAHLLLAGAAVAGYAADTASLSGKWQVHYSIADRENEYTCTFTQKDADLSGTCAMPDGAIPIAGKVDGQNVTWSYTAQYGKITFKGTLDPAMKIAGMMRAEDYGIDGQFTATQAK